MSDSEPPEDVSKDQMWDRLRKLEKHVYPDRRDVLKAGVGAAVGGAAVLGSTGSVSAATASGQVGTASNPVDVEAAAVNAGETNNAHTPETGTDLAPLIANGETLHLRPKAHYTLSSPITATENVTIRGLGSGRVDDNSDQPMVEYTGDTTQGPIYWDGANPVDNCTIENVVFNAGGADYGAYIRWLTNNSLIRNVGFEGFADSSLVGIDISREIYGRIERVHIDAVDASVTAVTLDKGVYIHNTDQETNASDGGAITHFPVNDLRLNMRGNGTGVHTGPGVNNVKMTTPAVEDCGQQSFLLEGSTHTIVHPYVENWGSNMTDPVGIEVIGGADIFGGNFAGGVTGGITVHVDPNASGSLIGGRYTKGDVDYHIQNESDSFTLNGVRTPANGAVTSFQSATPIFAANGTTDAPVTTFDETVAYRPEDLTQRSPPSDGYEAFHDGSGTPSASKCFSPDGVNWYNIVDGNTF